MPPLAIVNATDDSSWSAPLVIRTTNSLGASDIVTLRWCWFDIGVACERRYCARAPTIPIYAKERFTISCLGVRRSCSKHRARRLDEQPARGKGNARHGHYIRRATLVPIRGRAFLEC